MAFQAVRANYANRIIQGVLALHGLRDARSRGRSLDGIEALKSAEHLWDALAGDSSPPTQHFIWVVALAEAYAHAGRLRLITAGQQHAPNALALLVERPGLAGRLEALEARQVFEPSDFVYAEPGAARALAESLLEHGRAVWLPRVPAESPLPAALQAAYRGRGLVRIVPTCGCPYIDLEPSWREPERQFNAGRRSDFRRALRHAERLGKVSFEVSAPDAVELAALLDEAWAVEAAGWKGAKGSALARNARLGHFFRRYALAAARKGILRLCFMRIDGRAAAMQIATE